VATRADPQLDASAADQVDYRRVLGNPQRVLERQDDDRGTEPNSARAGSDRGEEDERRRQVSAFGAHVVVGDPHAVVPQLLCYLEQPCGLL
jgi:hypothetical protein